MSIVNPSDFLGKFEVSQNALVKQKLQGYIDLYEDQYMMDLLGVELYNEYKAGLAILPPDPLYVKLSDPFAEDTKYGCFENGRKVLISKGVKNMLLGFIYWEFYKDDFSAVSTNGHGKPTPENSTNSTTFLSALYTRYNESIDTYRSIQEYINQNRNLYPKYNGVRKRLAYWM